MSKEKDVMDAERQNFVHGNVDENGKVLIPGPYEMAFRGGCKCNF